MKKYPTSENSELDHITEIIGNFGCFHAFWYIVLGMYISENFGTSFFNYPISHENIQTQV